jgi:hypothetical protein
MLGDDMSIFLNTSVPLSILKKKHNAIAFHRVQEAIVAKMMRFAFKMVLPHSNFLNNY